MSTQALQLVAREHKGLLVPALLLAVTALAVWLYLLFFYLHQRDELQRNVTIKQQQLHDAGNSNNRGAYRRNEAALNKLLATVPTRSELPRILGQVTDLAALRKAPTELLSYKPVPSAVIGLQGYTLTIPAKGSYEAVKLLLTDLQQLSTLAYPESVSFANPDPQGDQIVMELRMALFLRQEAPP